MAWTAGESIERFLFIADTNSQLANGFRRQSANLVIKMQKPKPKPHQADEPKLDKQLGMCSDTDDGQLGEGGVTAFRPPPGLELAFCSESTGQRQRRQPLLRAGADSTPR